MIWRESIPKGVKHQLLKRMGATFLARGPKAQFKIWMGTMNFRDIYQLLGEEQKHVNDEINLRIKGT